MIPPPPGRIERQALQVLEQERALRQLVRCCPFGRGDMTRRRDEASELPVADFVSPEPITKHCDRVPGCCGRRRGGHGAVSHDDSPLGHPSHIRWRLTHAGHTRRRRHNGKQTE
jgi:hypothetical protein